MKKRNALLALMLLGLGAIGSFSPSSPKHLQYTTVATVDRVSQPVCDRIYDSLQLGSLGLGRQVFALAMRGHDELERARKLRMNSILSVVDFSLPSTVKRLFVIDLAKCRLLFNTYVAHGRNSGENMATSFSNSPESFKSSLGFYSTASIYNGKHGCSLQLEGLEKGFNDNALGRGIVMHAADYVSENVARQQGRLGRSLGCPAVPENLHRPIISAIANGSCLFMYANNAAYLQHSALIHPAKA